MGKKGVSNPPYVEYQLSFLMGFCTGPVESFESVSMKDKPLTEDSVNSNRKVWINKPDLFGGTEREGGAVGDLHYLLGDYSQLMPEAFCHRVELEQNDTPAHRGIATLFFTGPDDHNGFIVSANYPNVPPVTARIRRRSLALGRADISVIVSEVEAGEDRPDMICQDSNPAHMIYECLVDKVWGMGGHPRLISHESFIAVAETLYDERFGLSMLWTRSSTVEFFIQEILDHINGMIYFNPLSGKLEIKLLRDDYDRETLTILDTSNSKLTSFTRKLWGETQNEIVLTWTNPVTEEEESTTVQSLGNIIMQGDVVTEPRNYYGVRNAELAGKLAARDIVAVSYPLASATVEVDRRQFSVLPGAVYKFRHEVEGYGIVEVIVRVMEIDYGKPDDAVITLTVMEDVFALDSAQFILPPKTEWVDPSEPPNGPAYDQVIHKFVAAPYPIIQSIPTYELSDEDYPAFVNTMLVVPSPEQKDFQRFHVWRPGVDVLGDPTWEDHGSRSLAGRATLATGLDQEARSQVRFDDYAGNQGPAVGVFVLIGDEDEFEDEMVLITEFLGDDLWEVERGQLDTTPREFLSGATAWFIGPDFFAFDWSQPLANTPEPYKLQPWTSEGGRDLDLVPTSVTIRPARPYFPFRPANVKVDGVAFGQVDHRLNYEPRDWQIPVTWSNRHRMTEDRVARKWDEPPMTPEEGQTTTVRLSDTLQWHGIEGNSFDIDVMLTGHQSDFVVEVPSYRDEFQSLQYHSITLRLYPKGYGSDWGYWYGGWDDAVDLSEIERWDFLYDNHGWLPYEAIQEVPGTGYMILELEEVTGHIGKYDLDISASEVSAIEIVARRVGDEGGWIGLFRGMLDGLPEPEMGAIDEPVNPFVFTKIVIPVDREWTGTLTGMMISLWGPESQTHIESIRLLRD